MYKYFSTLGIRRKDINILNLRIETDIPEDDCSLQYEAVYAGVVRKHYKKSEANSCRMWVHVQHNSDTLRNTIKCIVSAMKPSNPAKNYPYLSVANIYLYVKKSPVTGHLVSGFSWFPWVLEQMLGWFPTVPSCRYMLIM